MKYIYTPIMFGGFEILERKDEKTRAYIPVAKFWDERLAEEYCRFKNAQVEVKVNVAENKKALDE